MFLAVQEEIAIVLNYRDAVSNELLLFDKKEEEYLDYLLCNGWTMCYGGHLELLELGRLLDKTKYNLFSNTDLEDMF